MSKAVAKVAKGEKISPKEMVTDALTTLNERKGISLAGIKSFIAKNYPVVDLEDKKVLSLIKRFLKTSLENGTIKKTTGGNMQLSGSFKLVIKPKKASSATEKTVSSTKKVTGSKKVAAKASTPKKAVKPKTSAKVTPKKKVETQKRSSSGGEGKKKSVKKETKLPLEKKKKKADAATKKKSPAKKAKIQKTAAKKVVANKSKKAPAKK